MVLKRFEYSIYGLIAFFAAIDLLLISQSSMQVDWEGYVPTVCFGLGLIAIGHFYRHYRKVERIASVMIGAGAFVGFTLVSSIFNYFLLPIHFPLIDEKLFAIDAFFGYSWLTMVEWAAANPEAKSLLRNVYHSAIPQVFIIMIVLGYSGRLTAMWHFLSTGVLGVIFCIGTWFFLPSFGPTTLVTISPETASGLALGPQYASKVLRLAAEGETFLSPRNLLGLVAFPSFHTVMAAMVVTFTWPMRWIRWPMLLLNIAMVPAILIHGSHYAVDVFAGLCLFIFAYYCVIKFQNIRYFSARSAELLN
jgi:hypothetical protein